MKKLLFLILLVSLGFTGYSQTRQIELAANISAMKAYRGTSQFILITDSATGGLYYLYTGGSAADETRIFAGQLGRKWRTLPPITILIDSLPTTGSSNPVSSKGVRTKLDSLVDAINSLGGGGGSGTVASGLANRLAYYAANGTTIDDLAAITANRALVSDANGLPTQSITTVTELGYISGLTSAIQTQLNAKAALASPAFTGTPTAPNATTGTSTTQLATTKFVQDAKDTLLASAEPIRVKRVTTTDNTPLNVDTITLANGEGANVTVEVKGTSSTGVYGAIKANLVYKTSGASVSAGTITNIRADAYLGTGLTTATVTITTISTTHAIVQVTGETGDTIAWVVKITQSFP